MVTSPRDEAKTKKNKNWKVILFLFLSYYFISFISDTRGRTQNPVHAGQSVLPLSHYLEPLTGAHQVLYPLVHAIRTSLTSTPPLSPDSNPTILFVAFSAPETLPQKIFFFLGECLCLHSLSALPSETRRRCQIPWSWGYRQLVVSQPTWVLGTQLNGLKKQYTLLTTELSSPENFFSF